jgi:hypothetical protein
MCNRTAGLLLCEFVSSTCTAAGASVTEKIRPTTLRINGGNFLLMIVSL